MSNQIRRKKNHKQKFVFNNYYQYYHSQCYLLEMLQIYFFCSNRITERFCNILLVHECHTLSKCRMNATNLRKQIYSPRILFPLLKMVLNHFSLVSIHKYLHFSLYTTSVNTVFSSHENHCL